MRGIEGLVVLKSELRTDRVEISVCMVNEVRVRIVEELGFPELSEECIELKNV